MTITQTVPDNRLLTIKVPREVPTGASVIIQFPVTTDKKNNTKYSMLSKKDAISMTDEVIEKYRPALEDLAK